MRLSILFALILSQLAAGAQPLEHPLHFSTVMSNHRIASLTIAGDSLVITRAANRPAAPETKRYRIVMVEAGGQYWLYVQQTYPTPSEQFSRILYYLSRDKKQLYLLDEVNSYPTLRELRAANHDVKPETKYFEKWYADSTFKVYSAYPSIAGADSITMYHITDDFVRQTMAVADKLHNTHVGDIYGAGAGQNILSSVLISSHLNPNVTLGQFSARIQQLNIKIPDVPLYHSPSRRPSFSSDTAHGLTAPRISAPH